MDSLGLLIVVVVVVANTSDNTGGIAVVDKVRNRSKRFAKLWCDAGFKNAFIRHCRERYISAEVVNRIHALEFVVLPKRWIVERSWSSMMK